jgi:hypothetical protein
MCNRDKNFRDQAVQYLEHMYLEMSRDMTIIQAKEERKKNCNMIATAVQQKGVLINILYPQSYFELTRKESGLF